MPTRGFVATSACLLHTLCNGVCDQCGPRPCYIPLNSVLTRSHMYVHLCTHTCPDRRVPCKTAEGKTQHQGAKCRGPPIRGRPGLRAAAFLETSVYLVCTYMHTICRCVCSFTRLSLNTYQYNVDMCSSM